LRRKIRGQEAGDEGQRIKGRHRARWYPVYQWTEITHRLAGLEAAGARYLPAYKVEGASLEAAKGAARRVPTTSSSPRALTINSTPPVSCKCHRPTRIMLPSDRSRIITNNSSVRRKDMIKCRFRDPWRPLSVAANCLSHRHPVATSFSLISTVSAVTNCTRRAKYYEKTYQLHSYKFYAGLG
jgi:hypothetical protein